MKLLKSTTLKTKIKLLSHLFILSGLIFGCSNDQTQIVPYVNVQIYINLDLPQFTKLTSVGNAYLYPNVGYNGNGVIIYRNSFDEFTAYDATCPQHIETKTAIKLDDNGSGGQATCPHCNTIYYFYNYGSSSKGYGLRQYTVSKSGNTLNIYN
jgi:hypothetical protein